MLKRCLQLLAVFMAACAGTAWSAPASAPLQLFERALVVVDLSGPSPPAAAAEIRLPYNWDTAVGAIDGQARFTLHFNSNPTGAPQALYILRIGNTFSIAVNGVQIARIGVKGPYEDYSKEPRLYSIPANVLKAENTLEITLDAQGGRHAGLTPVMIGNADELQAIYQRDYRWRITGALVIAVVSGVFGALALLLWLRQRNSLYVLYGLGELFWALQLSDTWLTRSPLPWPWWGVVVFSAYALAPVLICKFALEVVDLHHGWFRRVTNWQLALSVPLVSLSVLGGMPRLWALVQGLIVLVAVAVAVAVLIQGVRSDRLEQRVLALAVALTVAAAVRDFIVIRIGSSYGATSWARYAWVVFAITLAWIVAEHMRKDRRALALMNQTLMQELAAREAELKTVFERERAHDKARAAQEERARLMRDMHDGLGSQLVGALQIAKNPASPRDVVAAQLQDALDHLKLTVDAMQESDGDIGSLLGALRYRLAPRLEAAGIALGWEVAHLPLIPGWSIQRARDLQMILFEAFSNLIAHAGASRAQLVARYDDADGVTVVRVTLSDNGHGFVFPEPAAARGHGLANMHMRAANMGARLQLHTSAAGSRLELTLPLRAPQFTLPDA